jgi:hypothetical protein
MWYTDTTKINGLWITLVKFNADGTRTDPITMHYDYAPRPPKNN